MLIFSAFSNYKKLYILIKTLNTIQVNILRLYRFDNDDDNKMNGMAQTNFQMRVCKLDLHQRHKKSSKPQVQIRLTSSLVHYTIIARILILGNLQDS